VNQITATQIRDFYFKKNRNWSDGTSVRFFDRSESNPARSIFFSDILKRNPRQVDRYWIEQKFKSGDTAPSDVDSNQILLDLISRLPGSISYLSDDVTLPKNVKVIEVTAP
jgi:ABC-type phosphate transport system substrate-binding protein